MLIVDSKLFIQETSVTSMSRHYSLPFSRLASNSTLSHPSYTPDNEYKHLSYPHRPHSSPGSTIISRSHGSTALSHRSCSFLQNIRECSPGPTFPIRPRRRHFL